MLKSSLFFVLMFTLFLFPSLLIADEAVPVSTLAKTQNLEEEYRQKLRETITEEKPEEQFVQEFDSYARFMPLSGAQSQSGKVGVIDSASEYSYDFKMFGKLPTQAGAIVQYVSLNNSTHVKLPAYLTGVSFGMESTFPFFNFNKTYMRFGFAPSFFGDKWNFKSSSFRIPMRAFLIYQYSDKLLFVGGVRVRPDYEDVVLPIAGFIYKPTDRLTFYLVPERPNITYDLNKKWSVFIEGDGTDAEYEVNVDNVKNAVLRYNEDHVGGGVKFKPNKNIQAYLTTGCVFDRTIKYNDDSLGKIVLKNGLFTEFRLEINI